MTVSDDQDQSRWHLDKRVPIALILTISLQTIGLVWYVPKLDSRVEALEIFAADNKGLLTDSAVLRTRLDNIERSLLRIERAVAPGGG